MAIDLAPTAPPRELLAAQNSNLEDLKKSDIPDGSAHPGRTTQLASTTSPPPAAQAPAKNGSEPNHDRLFAAGQVDDWLKPIDASFPSESRDRQREFAKSPMAGAAGNIANSGGNPVTNPSQVQLASWNAPDGTSLRPVEPTVRLASRPAQTADSLATATNPQIRQTLLREAVVALAQGDTTAAIAAAQRGLAETPAQSAALYRVLGAAHYRRGEYQTAQAELAQALSLDNHDALAYFLMSATLEKLNDHQSAERFRAEAVRLDGRFGS
jgi:tetratricopeptide (TPR) repeat protein